MLGILKRTCPLIRDTKVRRTLYLTLVKSKLCYATEVWAPAIVKLQVALIIIIIIINNNNNSLFNKNIIWQSKTELHDVKCYKVINSKKIIYYNAI
jgi:hypothetical protein